MTDFDIPNEEELYPHKDYNYDLVDREYPIEENYAESTYNQFINLRDTLLYSGKKYKGKAWAKLVIWEKENTVEVVYRNMFVARFDDTTATTSLASVWPYVEQNRELISIYWPLCCEIKKDGRYIIAHKEQVNIQPWQSKVYTYVDTYRNWQLLIKWWTTVFDRQAQWTLSWSVSWGGSCSISFKLWDIFQKMTAFAYQERDLKAWDILVLRMKDAEPDADWNPQWNDLTLQWDSNWWSVEYKEIPLSNN